MLGRERDLRELPVQIKGVAARQTELEKGLDESRAAERRLAGESTDLEKKVRQLQLLRQNLEGELSKSQRELDRRRQEAGWQKDLGQQVEAERSEIAERRAELSARLSEAEKASEKVRTSLAELQRSAQELLATRANVYEQFNQTRTTLAVIDRAIESEKALIANHESLLKRLDAQREAKQERVEALRVESEQLQSQAEFLRAERADLERQVEALRECIEPALSKLAELDAEESILLAEESELKANVFENERQLVQANAAIQKCSEDLVSQRERMESEGIELPVEDTVMVEQSELADQPLQLSMRLRGGAAVGGMGADSSRPFQVLVLPQKDGNGANGGRNGEQLMAEAEAAISADPAALKRRIDRLRSQLRAIGPINPSAIEEYDETKNRFEHLETQIHDLTEAEKSLQEGLAVLEAQARKQFDAAFAAIGQEFSLFFTRLFGGGTARLIKADENDGGVGGIDIIAHPPGKRPQSLASLSGGERALTSTALLFAILKINPAPFCMLDEVDAALDEANVGRFTAALRLLSGSTQFIVITHNRGTVELADTLYGISLGADAVSKMVSLRVEEARSVN